MTLKERISPEDRKAPADTGRATALDRGHRVLAIDTDRSDVLPLRKDHRGLPRPPFECIALVLQGGGALGAFQAGVYEALCEADLPPDWVAGISIGAINAALIAGNPPETRVEKLRAFWDQMTMSPVSN